MPAVVFWLLAAVAIGGAFIVVSTREVMRLVVGLGAFLLSVAGFFLYFGMAFLAAAQVFVYVGGVLVLVLFALMVVARDGQGAPELTSRRDLIAASVAVGMFALMVLSFGEIGGGTRVIAEAPTPSLGDVGRLGADLLGPYLPHFEVLGGVLLAALVGVLAISGREERP